MSKETTNRTAVPGLDFLLAHPDFLQNHKPYKVLYLPKTYVPKLIELKREDPLDRRYEVLLNAFSAALSDPESKKSITIRPTDDDTVNEYKPTWHEYQTLGVAKAMSPHPVILTYDPGLRALALQHDLRVEAPLAKYYSGRRKVQPSGSTMFPRQASEISLVDWRHNYPDEPTLKPNEFVEFDWPDCDQKTLQFHNLHRYDMAAHSLRPLDNFAFRPPIIQDIVPENSGQAMLFEALLAPPEEIPIVIVSGVHGSGKTFLTVATAYAGVNARQYEHIYVCARDSRLGDKIGAVPGNTNQKTYNKVRSIEDSLRNVLRIIEPPRKKSKSKADKRDHSTKDDATCVDYHTFSSLTNRTSGELERFFSFIPMIELGGRSLPYSFIICDEFQDTNTTQAHAMITRFATRSKLVLLGDLNQISNPELSLDNNGLRFAIDRLAGKPHVAYINMLKSESTRHPIASAIAEYLS